MATNGTKRSKGAVLQPGHRAQSLQLFEDGILTAGTVERPQLRHGLTSVGDHERSALTDLLQVPAKPGFQFAGAHCRMPSHVVMMTTSVHDCQSCQMIAP